MQIQRTSLFTILKVIFISIALIFISSVIFAAQGDYQRKSISSLDTIWISPKAQSIVNRYIEKDLVNRLIEFYIENPRFDKNVLPDNIISNFISQARYLDEINATSLAELLNRTVVKSIVNILNDPEIQKARLDSFKDEAAYQSFAATKAKSYGLTGEELESLMNSAYIYLPFISQAYFYYNEIFEDDYIQIDGGIVWWEIVIDEKGATTVVEEAVLDTSGSSPVTEFERSDDEFVNLVVDFILGSPYDVKFGKDTWTIIDSKKRAFNVASMGFIKEMSIGTKKIENFKLSAQIVEKDGDTYGFPLGFNEGVHLDDGFYLKEYVENSSGEVESVTKGYMRVSKTGQNNDDETVLSYGSQIIGSPVSIGDMVVEDPKTDVSYKFNLGITKGINVTTEHLWNASSGDASQKLDVELIVSYNLAPVIGISQLFVEVDLGAGIMFVRPNSSEGYSNVIPITISPYLGIRKSFGKQLFIDGSVGIGFDILGNLFTYGGDEYITGPIGFGVKAGIAAGYIINPELKISGEYIQRFTLGDYSSSSYMVNGESYDGDPTNYNDFTLAGSTFSISLTWSLAELGAGFMNFLDPLKKF